MKWITRERPKIDRVACPWLIARFIDEEPRVPVRPAGPGAGAGPSYGRDSVRMPGVELTHDGPLCSFDAFLKKYDSDRSLTCTIWRSSSAARTRPGPTWPRSAPACSPFRWVCRTTSQTTTKCYGTDSSSTTPCMPGSSTSATKNTTGIRSGLRQFKSS